MRKVNQITWELVKKELDLKEVTKGEKINVLRAGQWSWEGYYIEPPVKCITIKAR